MGEMVKNELEVKKGITCQDLTVLSSTSTTSITIVTAVASTDSTASTSLQITTQTMYFSQGIITNLGTAATTTNIFA